MLIMIFNLIYFHLKKLMKNKLTIYKKNLVGVQLITIKNIKNLKFNHYLKYLKLSRLKPLFKIIFYNYQKMVYQLLIKL
jgi:hypothetical protein